MVFLRGDGVKIDPMILCVVQTVLRQKNPRGLEKYKIQHTHRMLF